MSKRKDNKGKGIIYLATNIINDKKYVGQTIFSLKKRILDHVTKSKRCRLGFPAAIKKYGIDGFKWEVIETVSRELLDEREIFYIKKYKSYATDGGYNLTRGGNNCFGSSGKFHFIPRMSRKKKKKWIKNHREGKNNPNYGNGNKISGKNHFLNKMSPSEKEEWLDKNLRGENNYQSKMSKKELKKKCHVNKMSPSEKEKWIDKNFRGKKNPFCKVAHLYSGKNSPSYGKKYELSKGAKTYVVTLPDGRRFLTKSITGFCDKFNQNNSYKINKTGFHQCANKKQDSYKGFLCSHFNKATDQNIPYYNGEKDRS